MMVFKSFRFYFFPDIIDADVVYSFTRTLADKTKQLRNTYKKKQEKEILAKNYKMKTSL